MVAPLFAAVSPVLEKSLVTDSTPSQFCFPNEFPYESFFSSTEDSTETEDETSDDEDDFLAGLTRRLALSTQRLSSPSLVTVKDEVKAEVTVDSSESTLGSPKVSSSPTSPFREEESLKVISAAAGEEEVVKTANKGRLNPNPNCLISVPYQNAAFCRYCVWQPHYRHRHQSQIGYGSILQPVMHASPYPIRGGAFAAVKQPSTGGTGVKQPSAGTGVFLPRNYPKTSDSHKKSGGGGIKVPTKVVHQQKPKMEQSKIDSVAGGRVKKERPLPQLQEWMH